MPIITVLEDDGHSGKQVNEMPLQWNRCSKRKIGNKQANAIIVDCDELKKKKSSGDRGVPDWVTRKDFSEAVSLSHPCSDLGEEHERMGGKALSCK